MASRTNSHTQCRNETDKHTSKIVNFERWPENSSALLFSIHIPYFCHQRSFARLCCDVSTAMATPTMYKITSQPRELIYISLCLGGSKCEGRGIYVGAGCIIINGRAKYKFWWERKNHNRFDDDVDDDEDDGDETRHLFWLTDWLTDFVIVVIRKQYTFKFIYVFSLAKYDDDDDEKHRNTMATNVSWSANNNNERNR